MVSINRVTKYLELLSPIVARFSEYYHMSKKEVKEIEKHIFNEIDVININEEIETNLLNIPDEKVRFSYLVKTHLNFYSMYQDYLDIIKYYKTDEPERRKEVDPKLLKEINGLADIVQYRFNNIFDFIEILDRLYFKTDNKEKSLESPIITSKQQMLVIYFLNKYSILNVNAIHPDKSKQARVLNSIFNRSYDNTYSNLKDINNYKTENNFFTLDNLSAVKKVFQDAEVFEIVKELEILIQKEEKKKI